MRRVATIALAIACAALFASAQAGASFGLKGLDVTSTDAQGKTVTQAGAHPFAFTIDLSTITKPEPELPEFGEVTEEAVKTLVIENFPGLAGNPTATPRCTTADFLATSEERGGPDCSLGSQVGAGAIRVGDPHDPPTPVQVFNLVPPPGVLLRLGLAPLGVRVSVEISVKSTPPYNPVATVTNVSNLVQFFGSKVTLWGVPADPLHDEERKGPANVPEVPFLTLPRACEGPLATRFEATSWEGSFFEDSVPTHDELGPVGFTDCERLDFAPRTSTQPSTEQVESASGLDFSLNIEDEELANPKGIAGSDIKTATVILPQGVTLNPSAAEGLETCSKAGFEAESLASLPGQGCPEASKVGTVEVETLLLEDQVLRGELFVARQDDPSTPEPGAENPFDSLLALYMVIKDPALGVLVKQAGRVSPNPTTGQLETTFGEPGDEIPQFPLSHVHIHLREGARSPLISPAACGTYTTNALFTPWADPSRRVDAPSSFEISRGLGGGTCPPAGPPPFAPGFSAGTLNNDAGSFSPFDVRITRRDGDQDLTKVSAVLPPGVLGTIAGLSKCTDAQIAAAKAKRGREELASPSCPAGSEIGHTSAGAGVGSQLTYVPGKLYLAGPYKGDPLSMVSITPAVAGPFDIGNVVLRFALTLNPNNLQVEVDGSASDPIPHILEGIVLKVRDLRAYVDRPHFISNPTNCAPLQTKLTAFGSFIDVFSPADDVPVNLTDRFQAANCAGLGFKPKLSLSLKGGTHRGDHPALTAVVTPRPHDANFAKAIVTLPRSAFLDQGHIRTICTRVQFAAKACPPGSVYGFAKAWSPLVDEPAEGPVYLRSSDHNLPDLVVALKGPPSAEVDFNLVGRIDSHKGGIRGSFESIPDVPVSKFVLEMQGGKKGLIVNSRGLCARPSKAIARLTGQNGRRDDFSPRVRPSGCGKAHRRH
jgi:hypothetical protein